MSLDERIQLLQRVYSDAGRWARDPGAVPRSIAAVDPSAKLAIIGEAVGPKTLRLSGVPYFNLQGKLGCTGINLDKLLSLVGYTLYPFGDVSLSNGIVKSASGAGRKTAYCTDICPVFPGYGRSRTGRPTIRRPTAELIQSALTKGFLQREIEIVRPTVILLLGIEAYQHFHRYFINGQPPKLATVLHHIKDAEIPTYLGAAVVPCFHPSSGSPAFAQWSATPEARRSLADRVNSYLCENGPQATNIPL